MRRHPHAIARNQRAMRRARTALRGLGTVRRTLDVVATTGAKISIAQDTIVPAPITDDELAARPPHDPHNRDDD